MKYHSLIRILAAVLLAACNLSAQSLSSRPEILGSAVDPANDIIRVDDASVDATAGQARKMKVGELANVPGMLSNGNYLAAFFSTSSENLKLAFSADGKTFSQFATNLVAGPNATLRDPSILLHGGVWYIAFSNNSFNTTTSFTISKSTDLITWTTHATVSLAAVSGLNRVWSPQLFVDDDGTVRAYVAGNDGSTTDTHGEFSIYHLTGSSDLSTWGPPTAVLSRAAGTKHYIDPCVVKSGSTYFMWVKEEYSNYLEIASSTSPTSGFSMVKTGNWAGWGSGLEGACVIQTESGFRLYADRYLAETGMAYSDSSAMLSGWSSLASAPMAGSAFRHGSVYRLTTTSESIRVAAAVLQASAIESATHPFGANSTARGHTIPSSLKIEERATPGATYWSQLILSHINGTGTYKGAIMVAYNDQLQFCRGVNANGVADPSVVMVDVPLATRVWDFKAGIKIAGGPTITSGNGAPSSSQPNGSIYQRADGTGPNLYVRENGAWVAK